MSAETSGPKRRWPALTLVLAVTLAWALGLHLARLPAWTIQREAAFAGGQPLLTTADGYYYLRLAEERSRGAYRRTDELRPAGIPRPARVPPVSAMVSALHDASAVSARELAFFLPPILGALSSLALALAGWAVAGPWGGLAAGLAGAASPFWFARCSLGWFDTDPLNLFFPTLASLTLTGFVFGSWRNWINDGSMNPRGQGNPDPDGREPERGPSRSLQWGRRRPLSVPAQPTPTPEPWPARLARLTLCAACVAGLALWWPSVGLLALPLFGLTYGTSLMAPSSRAERTIKLALLLLIPAGAGFLGLGLHRHLPQALAGVTTLGDSALGHLGLITKSGSGAFAEVGQSISELAPLSADRLGPELAGGWLPIAAAALGLFLAMAGRAWPALMLALPFLLLGALSVHAQRFVIFLVPAYALGLALLVGSVPRWPHVRRLHPVARHSLAALLVAGLAAPGALASLDRPVRPAFDAAQAAMAMSINPTGANRGLVWNWWDQGYFLQYFTRMPTIIDGGSQDPERVFLASLPLATRDPAVAARWMRFVSVRGAQGFRDLSRRLGGARTAARLLRAVFASPEMADDILASAGLNPADWRSYLFPAPRKPIFVYLTADMIYRGWWHYYGNLFGEHESEAPPQTLVMPVDAAEVDVEKGLLRSGDKALAMSALLELSRAGIERHAGADPDGPVLLRMEGATHLTIIGQAMYKSLACRLLFDDPANTPGFTLLAHHPFVGGVWLVR